MGREADIQHARNLIARNQCADAAKVLRRLVTADPGDAVAHADLAQALWRAGKPVEAVPFAQRAVELVPGVPPFHILLGHCLCLARRVDDGALHLAKGVELDPRNPQARVLLIEALATLYRWDEVAGAARSAIEAFPAEHAFYPFLAHAMSQSGQVEESAAVLAEGAAKFPMDGIISMTRAVHSNYREGVDRREQLELHRVTARVMAATISDPLPPPTNDPNPDRPLRVGVMSPDLRGHSVMFFADALLKRLDPKAFRLSVFNTHAYPDPVTTRVRAELNRAGAQWHDVASLSSRDLALLIRKQRIDVLIELSGLTMNHRLAACALRAAPVQVSAIGYPGTTATPHITARLVDSLTDPAGEEAWHTEQLVRLDPCFLCYTPMASAPEVSALPAARSGFITFGSFNAATKFTDHTLRLWGRVLDRVPGSRLMLKVPGTERPQMRAMVDRRLTGLGLDLSRLDILARTDSPQDHLAQYAGMDVALDTFPYNGTTTTCEALYMGLPVVSRVGDRHASRVGLSLLSAAGHPDWAAASDDEFVRVAAALAADIVALAGLRAGLRGQLRASPLCDGAAYGRRLGEALRALWRAWCAQAR